jgi:hypothetical protein
MYAETKEGRVNDSLDNLEKRRWGWEVSHWSEECPSWDSEGCGGEAGYFGSEGQSWAKFDGSKGWTVEEEDSGYIYQQYA